MSFFRYLLRELNSQSVVSCIDEIVQPKPLALSTSFFLSQPRQRLPVRACGRGIFPELAVGMNIFEKVLFDVYSNSFSIWFCSFQECTRLMPVGCDFESCPSSVYCKVYHTEALVYRWCFAGLAQFLEGTQNPTPSWNRSSKTSAGQSSPQATQSKVPKSLSSSGHY